MSSVSSLASIFAKLDSITAFRIQPTTPGDTLTTAALARLAASIPVASIASFTTGKPFFTVGDGGTELSHVASAAGSAIAPVWPLGIAQSSGARVVEAFAYPLGHIAEGSAKVGGSGTSIPIPAATSATPIGFIYQGGSLTFALALLDYSVRTLALAYGMEELETGAGTSTDPYRTVASQGTIGTHGLLCFRATGKRKDNKTLAIDMLDCTINPNPDINISGKAVNPIAVAGSCTAHIHSVYA